MENEKETTALVTIEPVNALAIFTTPEKVDPIIAAIRQVVAEFEPDVATAKGRKEIASIAHKVAQSKTYLDGIGKKLTDEYKEIPKKIDANRKRIRDELDALKDEVRKPLTDWEYAEELRVQGIRARISGMYLQGAQTQGSVMVGLAIKNLEGIAIDDSFGEFVTEAAQVKDKVLAELRACLEACIKREAEQAELARLREEAAKREQVEREAKIAAEAAQKAKDEAERIAEAARVEAANKAKAEQQAAERRELEAKLAAEKAEREKLEAVERSRLAQEQAEKAAAQAKADAERKAQEAVEAERRRAEQVAAAKQADDARRQADEANQFRVHGEIVDDLVALGIERKLAVEFCYAVGEGRVRNVSIKY